jgi:NitT/TauT family transport system substrate-binding protein
MARRIGIWLVVCHLLLASACAAPTGAPAPAGAAPPAAVPPGSSSAAAPAAPAGAAPAALTPLAEGPAPAAAPAPQTVRYGHVPILASGAMYLALDRGYFAERGIDVEMVSFDSGALLIPAVAAGQLEAGHGVPGPALFNALARSVTMKAVSVISWNTTELMLRQDLADSGQIRSLQDLKGKRVSLMVEGSPIDFTMRRALYQNGMTLQDIEVQRLSMPDTPPALANSALDAGAVVEPFPVLIESRGIGQRALDVQRIVWQDAASIIMLGPTMLGRGDAANTAFLAGWAKGLRDLLAALQDSKVVEPAALESISRWTKIPPEVVGRASFSGTPPDGRVSLDDLVRQQDFWAQEGDVRTKADLGQFVEYKYLDAAVSQLR